MQQDLSLRTLIPVYLDALEAEGKSPRTIAVYAECLSFHLKTAAQEQLPTRLAPGPGRSVRHG
jgi:hypothetical protein